MSDSQTYQTILKEAGLKVTPQRLAVLEAVYVLDKHTTSEEISNFVKRQYPSMAIGTVYNILNFFVSKGIISRVKTDKGAMLYDIVSEKHHHLYCMQSDRIEDYYNNELDRLLEDFFSKKKIRGFEIEDIKLQLVGRFREDNSQS
jgi:Fur family transcriptional regulator, peroxide stress response regulator